MLKLWGDSVLPSLELIFKSCLESVRFPSEYEKANLFPVHKKGYKQSLKNSPYDYSLFVEKPLNDW